MVYKLPAKIEGLVCTWKRLGPKDARGPAVYETLFRGYLLMVSSDGKWSAKRFDPTVSGGKVSASEVWEVKGQKRIGDLKGAIQAAENALIWHLQWRLMSEFLGVE
jgi:hypothetical protein